MIEDDKYMDDQFKKASEESKFPYQSSFWDDVESQLADESLDSAFKVAASNALFVPQMNLAESIDDAFLDESFKSAATVAATEYKPEYWEQFQANLPLIQQDEAFLHASNSTVTPYQPHYWSDADVALQNEGLHYEYKSAYWNEAKVLLDKADRGIFFLKWSAVATLLLLLSFGGMYQMTGDEQLAANGMNGLHEENSFVASVNENYNTTSIISAVNKNDNSNELNSDSNLNSDENNLNDSETNQMSNSQNSSNANFTIDRSNQEEHQIFSHAIPVLSMNAEPTLAVSFNQQTNTEMELGFGQPDVSSLSLTNPNSNDLTIGLNNTNQSLNEKNEQVDLGIFNKLAIEKISKINVENEVSYLHPEIEIVKKSNLPSTHTVSIIGQVGLGNKYGTVEFTPSWRTSFGVEYLNTSFGRLRNFEMGASLSLNHARQNDFGTERRVSVFQKDGGVDKFWYKLQIKDMLYANLSATCNYRINQRHKVKLNIGFDYLVFVQSNMSYQNKADQGITTVNNNWGVKDGLNKFDIRVGAGYELQLTNRIALQANASYGFFDRTDNDFLGTEISDHEMNITVGIKYTLFRKL